MKAAFKHVSWTIVTTLHCLGLRFRVFIQVNTKLKADWSLENWELMIRVWDPITDQLSGVTQLCDCDTGSTQWLSQPSNVRNLKTDVMWCLIIAWHKIKLCISPAKSNIDKLISLVIGPEPCLSVQLARSLSGHASFVARARHNLPSWDFGKI